MSVDIYKSGRPLAPGLQTFNVSDGRSDQMRSRVAYLPESGQVARILTPSEVPKDVIPEGRLLKQNRPSTGSGDCRHC